MTEYGLEEKELEEFNAVISGVLIPELIRIADKYNYNRDSMVKFAADTLTAMSELATFEHYKAESGNKCEKCEYYFNPDYTRCHTCKAESEVQDADK